jgi:hypothetical protein
MGTPTDLAPGTKVRPRVLVSVTDPVESVGLDFDWLASDAEGYVAVFASAGGEIPPDAVLADMDAHVRALEALLTAPVHTRALFAPPGPGEERWRAAAERGLFVYRCSPGGGPYLLAAAPETPIRTLQLPAGPGLLVQAMRFGQLRFRYIHSVTPDVLLTR